jgi:hypothetical protein
MGEMIIGIQKLERILREEKYWIFERTGKSGSFYLMFVSNPRDCKMKSNHCTLLSDIPASHLGDLGSILDSMEVTPRIFLVIHSPQVDTGVH